MKPAAAKLEEFTRACKAQGLPLTIQRRAVLEELAAVSGHPTADEVHARVSKRVPGLARATVYRALDALVGAGVARRVLHSGAAIRYEVKTHRHHHLVCTGCGKIVDLEDPALDNLPVPETGEHGFSIDDYTVQFFGRCPACTAGRRRRRPWRKTRQEKRT